MIVSLVGHDISFRIQDFPATHAAHTPFISTAWWGGHGYGDIGMRLKREATHRDNIWPYSATHSACNPCISHRMAGRTWGKCQTRSASRPLTFTVNRLLELPALVNNLFSPILRDPDATWLDDDEKGSGAANLDNFCQEGLSLR